MKLITNPEFKIDQIPMYCDECDNLSTSEGKRSTFKNYIAGKISWNPVKISFDKTIQNNFVLGKKEDIIIGDWTLYGAIWTTIDFLNGECVIYYDYAKPYPPVTIENVPLTIALPAHVNGTLAKKPLSVWKRFWNTIEMVWRSAQESTENKTLFILNKLM